MALPNGSADQLQDRARRKLTTELEAWADQAVAKVGLDIGALPHDLGATLDTQPLLQPVFELGLHTAMLGALDVLYEVTTGRGVARQFALRSNSIPGVGIANFTRMPFAEAVHAFLERKSVTRREWDRMTLDARKRSFTCAYLAKRSAVEVVRKEVQRGLVDGWTVPGFKKDLAKALKTKGMSPLSPWHMETIVRTNAATSHAQGRKTQQSTPIVRETHPWWEYDAILDRTTRKTHAACEGVTVRADDPIWTKAYPPCGFNCRCSCISRRKASGRWGTTAGFATPLAALPDRGWKSAA